jgi:hypothetical protein
MNGSRPLSTCFTWKGSRSGFGALELDPRSTTIEATAQPGPRGDRDSATPDPAGGGRAAPDRSPYWQGAQRARDTWDAVGGDWASDPRGSAIDPVLRPAQRPGDSDAR